MILQLFDNRINVPHLLLLFSDKFHFTPQDPSLLLELPVSMISHLPPSDLKNIFTVDGSC